MAGTDRNGNGQGGYERDWDELFPPIDYDAVDNHAREAAKVAVSRCWVQNGGALEHGAWSDEMRSDFAWWADELTAAYMAESHALYRPRRMLALMRDPEVARIIHVAMRGRQNAIYTRYRRTCYEALWTAFFEFARFVGRIPQTTMPPASPPAQQRRKEVI